MHDTESCAREGCLYLTVWGSKFCPDHQPGAIAMPSATAAQVRKALETAARVGTDPAVPGQKADDGKPRWDLLPLEALSEVVLVLTYGANKYSPENWRVVPEAKRRYLAAAWRHLVKWALGERRDPESGLLHLAHAACCLMFLLELVDIPASRRGS